MNIINRQPVPLKFSAPFITPKIYYLGNFEIMVPMEKDYYRKLVPWFDPYEVKLEVKVGLELVETYGELILPADTVIPEELM